MNPIDILGVDPSGAHVKTEDARDYTLSSPEVGMAPAPFDWEKGYDIEKEIGFILPTKDQGGSGSCGGQAESEYEQAFAAGHLGDTSEKSAKAPYSQVFVPGGGSNSRMLGDIVHKQGMFGESFVPSYPSPGTPPDEAFMERPQDISQAARNDAAKTAGLIAYVYTHIDIDTIAAAMRDSFGIFLGIHGTNNGTWLSSSPAVTKVGDYWAHFMYGGKAGLVNGKKSLGLKQSWGAAAAPSTNGWQTITEDHFNAGQIWDAMIFKFSPMPPKTGHTFTTDIHFGQTSEEVRQLQVALANDGCFNLAPTSYYGDITARAVLKFRLKHGVDTSTDKTGHIIGPRTREALNAVTK